MYEKCTHFQSSKVHNFSYMLLGLKSFTCFQNQNSVQCEFVLKITSMILDQIAWYEVQLVIAEFSCSNA